VVTAGTSDFPVAEECAVTLDAIGHRVARVTDVGVAGIHRILARRETLADAAVVIVIAGMDGALPSVVGGLVRCPVIAVPTSIGYGAAFGGLAPLLTMLNSCAAGVLVCNIDNGLAPPSRRAGSSTLTAVAELGVDVGSVSGRSHHRPPFMSAIRVRVEHSRPPGYHPRVATGATGFDCVGGSVAARPGPRVPGKTLGNCTTANSDFALAA